MIPAVLHEGEFFKEEGYEPYFAVTLFRSGR